MLYGHLTNLHYVDIMIHYDRLPEIYPALALENQTVAMPRPDKVLFPVLASAVLYKVNPDP